MRELASMAALAEFVDDLVELGLVLLALPMVTLVECKRCQRRDFVMLVHQPLEFGSRKWFCRFGSGAPNRIAALHLSDLVIDGEEIEASMAHSFRELMPKKLAAFSGLELHLIEPTV